MMAGDTNAPMGVAEVMMVWPWGGSTAAELTISGAFHGLCSFVKMCLSAIAKTREHLERIQEHSGISKGLPRAAMSNFCA